MFIFSCFELAQIFFELQFLTNDDQCNKKIKALHILINICLNFSVCYAVTKLILKGNRANARRPLSDQKGVIGKLIINENSIV